MVLCVPALARAQPATGETTPPAPPIAPVAPIEPIPPADPTPPQAVPPPVDVREPAVAAGVPPVDSDNGSVIDDDYPLDGEKHKKPKGIINYKPGRYIEFRASKQTRVRLRLTVQPLARYTNVSTLPDAQIDTLIRRARFGFHVKLSETTGLKWELQVKNMHLGLSNLYGEWAPGKRLQLVAGFIKAPGGLERDTYSFDEPFIERSVLAFFTYDHEMGVKLSGWTPHHEQFWAAALTRNAPFGVDGGDPEDKPLYPANVEPDDITRSSSKFNSAGRVGIAPSDAIEASVNVGGRFRLDDKEPDYGDRVAEPYDSSFVAARAWTGAMIHASADVALSQPHWRLMAEGGVRRDGQQLSVDLATGALTKLNGHMNAEMGYLVFGWTPNGHYGPAIENAALKDGWELVVRVEGARVKPVDISRPITFVGVTTGFHYEVSPQLRLQADFGFQRYSSNAENTNVATALDSNSKRYLAQLWATWRL